MRARSIGLVDATKRLPGPAPSAAVLAGSVPVGPLSSCRPFRPSHVAGSLVANIKSQIKRNRQNEKRRRAQQGRALRAEDPHQDRRRGRRARRRGRRRAARLAQKRIDKAAAKGVIHKNQAARRKSRLMKRAQRRRRRAPLAAQPRSPPPSAPGSSAASRATSTSITSSAGQALRCPAGRGRPGRAGEWPARHHGGRAGAPDRAPSSPGTSALQPEQLGRLPLSSPRRRPSSRSIRP